RRKRRQRRRCQHPIHRQGFLPRVEALGDRCLPSTLTVTSSADDMQPHTLRYAVAHAQSGDTVLLTSAIKAPIVLTHGELLLTQNITIEHVANIQTTVCAAALSTDLDLASG